MGDVVVFTSHQPVEEEEVEKSLSEILGFDLEALLAEEVAREDEIFEEPEPEVETVAEETVENVAGETPTLQCPLFLLKNWNRWMNLKHTLPTPPTTLKS